MGIQILGLKSFLKGGGGVLLVNEFAKPVFQHIREASCFCGLYFIADNLTDLQKREENKCVLSKVVALASRFSMRRDVFYSPRCLVVAASHIWPLSPGNVASVTEELIFNFYLVLPTLNLNSRRELVVIELDGVGLKKVGGSLGPTLNLSGLLGITAYQHLPSANL